MKLSYSSKGGSPGVFGTLFGVLFGAAFLFVGLFLFGVMATSAVENLQTYFWTPVSATIEKSEVSIAAEADSPYDIAIRYRYEYNGSTYHSTRYSLFESNSGQYTDLHYLVEKYRPGTSHIAYVRQDAPEQAVLVRGRLWLFPLLLFPLVFVLLGAIVLYAVLGSRRVTTPGSVEAISEGAKRRGKTTGRSGRLVATGFFFIFFAVGCLAFQYTFLKPFQQHRAAQTWQEVTGIVLSSRVKTHEGEDSDTYSADIFYSYSVGGRLYRSNRYTFFRSSSGNYRRVRALVGRYPPGTAVTVYYDPANPAEAVLTRTVTKSAYAGLLTLLFVVVGAGGIWVTWSGTTSTSPNTAQKQGERVSRARFGLSQQGVGLSSEIALQPSTSPKMRFMGAVLLATFWNGLIAFPVAHAYDSWQQNSPEWMLTLMMIPFVAIGGVCIFIVGYSFLLLFNPKPTIYLDAAPILLGETLSLRWRLSGVTSRLQALRLMLVGEEEAKYRRGTTTYTDTETFFEEIFAERGSAHEFDAGSASVRVPLDSMHSFSAAHNRIRWSIKVQGEISGWPDLDETFPITVEPARDE